MYQGARGGEQLIPHNIMAAHASLGQSFDQVMAVRGQVALLWLGSKRVKPTDGLDMCVEEFPQLPCHLLGCEPQWERLDRVDIVENAGKHQCQHRIKLLLVVDAFAVVFRLQRQSIGTRGEVHRYRVADVPDDVDEVCTDELV